MPQAVGIARAAYEFLLERIQATSLHGTPMASHQHIMFELAEMNIGRSRRRACSRTAPRGSPIITSTTSRRLRWRRRTARAPRSGSRHARWFSSARKRSSPATPSRKWYRDAKIYDIFEGTGQIQRRIIAKTLTGVNPT